MDRVAFDAMLAQYATPEVSGDGRVSWENGVRCVMPSVKLYGKCQQDTLTGKNLFDPNAEAVMDGSYYGYKQYFSLPKPFTLSISLKPGKALPTNSSLGYIVKQTEDSSNVANWLVLNGEINSEYDCKLVIKETNYYMEMIGMYPPSSLPSFLDALNIQIELGSVATAYEPYCGGIPAPNPSYPIMPVCNDGVVKSIGENLWDKNGVVNKTFNGLTTSLIKRLDNGDVSVSTDLGKNIFGQNVSEKITPGKSYTLSCVIVSNDSNFDISMGYDSYKDGSRYVRYAKKENPLPGERIVYSFTLPEGLTNVCFGVSINGFADEGTKFVYRDMMLVEGKYTEETMPSYTPYYDGGQATAPGLMVAVDGSCQSTFDTQTGKLTDWWWPEIVLDGSEDEKWVAYTSSAFVGFRTGITALPEKMLRNAYWCNMLIPSAKQFTSTKPHLWCGVNTPVLFALASPTVGFPYYDETLDDFGLADWKAHLAEHPLHLWVARNEPLITYATPAKLTMPPGAGQIIQTGGDVADCPISAKFLTHS